MAKKNKNDYFQLIESQVACCVEAAELLENIMSHYFSGSVSEQRNRMHDIEHRADEIYHDMLRKLSAEFITPIDQEDIVHLIQIVDDVTDALDEIVFEFYMYHIEETPTYAAEISKIVRRCVAALYEAATELKNFKKPEKLRVQLVEVNTIEGEADEAYTKAIHHLFGSESDAKKLIGHKAIYESLENCCDLCEHAADVIEQIIIKNT